MGGRIAMACVVLMFGVIVAGIVVTALATTLGGALVGFLLVTGGAGGVLITLHAWTDFIGAA